jgi:hypothetical protein
LECKRRFYSAKQILATKDKELNQIWLLMVLLALGLTTFFNTYICPTEVTVKFFHGI